MKHHISILFLTLVSTFSASGFTPKPASTIWFDTPNPSSVEKPWLINDMTASYTNPDPDWELRSLPIGNGSFGASVLGSIGRERIVLNEKSLWLGGPATGVDEYWDMNRKVDPATLDSVRTLLAEGKNAEADRIVSREFRGTVPYDRKRFGTFTTMGEAYVTTGIDEKNATDYSRSLDLDSAMVTVDFNASGQHFTRRYFASYPDSVMVWSFTSDKPQPAMTFSFASPHRISAILPAPAGNGLTYTGSLEGNSMQWALSVIARAPLGGTVIPDYARGTITITGAPEVQFILAAATDFRPNPHPDFSDPATYRGGNAYASATSRAVAASAMDRAGLFARHLADYTSLYCKADISINPDGPRSLKPTPQRLADYRDGAEDFGLEELYFRFGRYLLISSSRPGSLPANLQGLWHNNLDGPWHMDYHNNINLQMNYWPATVTNLEECFIPLSDYVVTLVEPGRRTASDYYGARGWTAAISGNPFGFTAPLDSPQMEWNYNPSAGPWLATQLWDYFLFSRDRDWLRETGYPVIKESADFAADLLSPAGEYLTVAPSYSPEHGTADLGATYVLAVTRQILADAIAAARELGTDEASVAEWSDKLSRIAPYRIGRTGQLQEWWNDIDDPDDKHRHTNHLFGLHPGNTINPLTDTLLVNAAKTTLRQRGDEATGWSMGWKLNHWARLLDGDHAYILFGNLLKEGTADNLWDQHPPFQIDGNFGGTAGVAEMLLQSHNRNTIHLLPALPAVWKNGSVRGLKARGGFEVDMEFADGRLIEAEIRSLDGQPCTVRYGDTTRSFPTERGKSYILRGEKLMMD